MTLGTLSGPRPARKFYSVLGRYAFWGPARGQVLGLEHGARPALEVARTADQGTGQGLPTSRPAADLGGWLPDRTLTTKPPELSATTATERLIEPPPPWRESAWGAVTPPSVRDRGF
jgi:hypothetical protein